MANAWLSYAWANNRDYDVDYVAQLLTEKGLSIRMDKNRIQAGKRIWEQIGNLIMDPNTCNAWIIYATQESLSSNPVKEELYYALDRALETRGSDFPIIAIFPESIDKSLIPPVIKTRLYVSLIDPDWIERVIASSEGRLHLLQKKVIDPYDFKIWKDCGIKKNLFCVEVRPRAGVWNPILIATPIEESECTIISYLFGAPGIPPTMGTKSGLFNQGISDDGKWNFNTATIQSTPSISIYMYFNKLPTKLLFGDQFKGQYIVNIS